MPSSAILIKHIPSEKELPQLKAVIEHLENAQKHGMQYEWMTWFIGGVRQGMPLWEAAAEAAIEWDL